jgi:tetratricopeptide (TPR) repeat protein
MRILSTIAKIRLSVFFIFVFFIFFFFSSRPLQLPQALGQEKFSSEKEAPVIEARHIKIDLTQSIILDYLSRSWNQDSKKIDRGLVVLKETSSNSLILLEVTETSPKSSRFLGTYIFDPTSPVTEGTVEIYIPPRKISLQKTQKDQKEILTQMIQDRILVRKPYFFRRELGQQKLTVYDSKAHALEAYRYFVRSGESRRIINPNLLETQALAQSQSLSQKKEQEALPEILPSLPPVTTDSPEAPHLSDESGSSSSSTPSNPSTSSDSLSTPPKKALQSLVPENILEEEALLKQQQEEKAQKIKTLKEEEQNRQRELAQKRVEEGLALYSQGLYAEASEKFNEALNLDPLNKSFYYQYGVTLFRLDQYEKSAAYLNQSEPSNTYEKSLFLGLNYLKLKKTDLAYSSFDQAQKDPRLSVTAQFYRGVINYNKENWNLAQKQFEEVLDQSQDPKIDQASEYYIEQILNMKKYQELQSKKWTLTGTLGSSYDSNILTVSPNAVPTNLNGFRAQYGFNLEYRPIFNETHEFLGQISFSDMYSMDSGFVGSSTFQNIDPLITQILFPYRWKGSFQNKMTQLGVSPYWRSIQMNADGVGQREVTLSSTGLNLDWTLVQSEQLTSLYSLDLRQDLSLMETTPDENQSASFFGFNTTQTYFYNPADSSQAFMGDLGFARNQAKGRNQKFQSFNVGLGYLQPGYFQALWIGKLTFTQRDFFEHTLGRKDTLINATILAQKQLSRRLQASTLLSFNKSISTLSFLTYDQFLLMGQLTWQIHF